MARHNTDIAACNEDRCPLKIECLRWQLGTNKDPYQTYFIVEDYTNCDYFVKQK